MYQFSETLIHCIWITVTHCTSPSIPVHIFCFAYSLLLIIQRPVCIPDTLMRTGSLEPDQPTRSYTLREHLLASAQMPSTLSSSSARSRRACSSRLHVRMPTSSILCGAYTDGHSCCEFMTALVLSADTGLLWSFLISHSSHSLFLKVCKREPDVPGLTFDKLYNLKTGSKDIIKP